MTSIACTNCGRDYPENGILYRCSKCGGIFDYKVPLKYDPSSILDSQPGIWKYKETFNLLHAEKQVSLGEGDTPLVWSNAFGLEIGLKCEYINPTGSFKDRGSALIASHLLSRNVISCIEDSSGNAGSSLAAYSARSGIHLEVYVPGLISDNKRNQIMAYGADLISVDGTREDVHQATRKRAEMGAVYASHAYLPFNIPGYATIAYEIINQMNGLSPSEVILPVGQGGLLLGIYRGFHALKTAGLIDQTPKIIGVQARKCAPLWSLFTGGVDGLRFATDNPTLAEGVRVWHPIRGDEVLKAVGSSDGFFVAVDEQEIMEGAEELAQRGFYVELTSAIVWSALKQCKNILEGPIIMILTGSGLKNNLNQ